MSNEKMDLTFTPKKYPNLQDNQIIGRKNPQEDDFQELKPNVLTPEQSAKLKEDLSVIMDSMAQNSSFFNRMVAYWIQAPWWIKGIFGLGFISPPLIIGIVAHITALLIISICVSSFYISLSLIFYNHNQYDANNRDSMQSTVFGLVDELKNSVDVLDKLSDTIGAETSYFENENSLLKLKIQELSDSFSNFENETAKLNEIDNKLSNTNDNLEQTSNNLRSSLSSQNESLQVKQKIISRLHNGYADCQRQLSEKINELEKIRENLGEELAKQNNLINVLKNSAKNVSSLTINNDSNRQEFHDKLEIFVSNKEENAKIIAERINEAQKELAVLKEALNLSNKQYSDLLNRQGNAITRLEPLYNQHCFYSSSLVNTQNNNSPESSIVNRGTI